MYFTPPHNPCLFNQPAEPYLEPIPLRQDDAEAVVLSLFAEVARLWIASRGPLDAEAEAASHDQFMWSVFCAYLAAAADASTVDPENGQ